MLDRECSGIVTNDINGVRWPAPDARAGRRHAFLWRDLGLGVLAGAGACWDLGWAGVVGQTGKGISRI